MIIKAEEGSEQVLKHVVWNIQQTIPTFTLAAYLRSDKSHMGAGRLSFGTARHSYAASGKEEYEHRGKMGQLV